MLEIDELLKELEAHIPKYFLDTTRIHSFCFGSQLKAKKLTIEDKRLHK